MMESLALIDEYLRDGVAFLHDKRRFHELYRQAGLEMPFNVT